MHQPGAWLRRRRGRAPGLVLALALALLGAYLVDRARSLWFFGDDFDFLLNRSITLTGDHGLLVPHNEHWSTVPILLFRLNFAFFGLHHYLPYALVSIGFHLLICVLSLALLRWCGVGSWVAVTATLVVAFLAGGAGAENTLWDFQAGFLGSCLFGLLALVLFATDRWAPVSDVVGVAALVLSLMSSGMGVVMLIWAAVFLLAHDGLRAALVRVAVPVVVYLAWYGAYGHGHVGAPPGDLAVAPLAAVRGLGTFWSTASGVPGAGPIMLFALVLAVIVPRHGDRLFALAASGLVTVVAMYALLGYSRSGLGVDAALRSRYVYFGVVLTVPALAAGLGMLTQALAHRPASVTVVAWSVTVALVVGVGAAQADRWTTNRRPLISGTEHRLAEAARLVESGAPLLRTQPMPKRNPDVTTASLSKPSVRAAVPDLTPDNAARLYAAAHLQVDVSVVERGFDPPALVTWRGFAAPRDTSAGSTQPSTCETRTAKDGAVIEVVSNGAATEFGLTVITGEIGTQLSSGDQRSPVVRWDVRPRVPFHVATTADATLRVVVPAGPVTLCGAAGQ